LTTFYKSFLKIQTENILKLKYFIWGDFLSKRGRMGGSKAAGPGGSCKCPKCGKTMKHQVGIPCSQQNCPKCGTKMVRK